jgi:hypothetical protein
MNYQKQRPGQPSADARSITCNPNHTHSAHLRTLAWAALKAERGQTVHQHRLQAMHVVHAPTSTTQGI